MTEETEQDSANEALEEVSDNSLFEKIVIATICSLLVIAVVSLLYFAKALLLPIFMAIFLALVLQPMVRRLDILRLGRPVSAGIVMFLVGAVLTVGAYQLTAPALDWINRIPDIADKLEREFWQVRQSLEAAEEASAQIEEITQGGSGDNEERVVVAEESLTKRLFSHAPVVAGQIGIAIGLLFFLLAFGQATSNKVISAFETRGARRRLREVIREIERRSAIYLRTMTMINLGVGIATTFALWLLNAPNAPLWGVMAACLNFMPYLGPTLMMLIIGIISIITFDQPLEMVAPVLAFGVITTIEGQFITPSIMGKQMTLNPIAVFLAIVIWFWIWGVAGAIIAVPLLASIKIVADELPALRALSAFLDRPEQPRKAIQAAKTG